MKIDDLAKEIGATKGSFYWHFKDISAFQREMLATWKARATDEVIVKVDTEMPLSSRLHLLIEQASQPAPKEFGGRFIEPAIRAWAMHHESIARAVNEVDEARIDFLCTIFADQADPRRFSELFYASYIGASDLASKGRGNVSEILRFFASSLKG